MSFDGVAPLRPYGYPASPYASPSDAVSTVSTVSSRDGSLSGVSEIDILDPELSRTEALGGISGAERPLHPAGSSSGFGEVLAGALRDAVVAENSAVASADALARGENDDVHGTMISAKEADISLKLVGAVRNKLLDAFHELWRTNV